MQMFLYSRNFTARHFRKLAYLMGVTASPLLIRALLKGPLKGFEFSARTFEMYEDLMQKQQIPPTTLSEIVASDTCPQEIWLDISNSLTEMTSAELAILCSVIKWKQPRVVVEIGTYKGFTTQHLSRNTSNDCKIFTVDLPPETAPQYTTISSDPQLVQMAGKFQRVFGNDPKIRQILQDSTTIQWQNILNDPVDLALVDASHLYDHVKADTQGIMRVLAPDAIVLWHDYRSVEVRRGVTRYLNELHRAGLPLKRFADTSFCIYQHRSAVDMERMFAA